MSAFRRCWSLTLIPLVLGLITWVGTAPVLKGQTGRIVFEHAPDDEAPMPTRDICSVNADGTELRALTNDGHSHSPRWSPDGRHILYLHETSWPSRLPALNIRMDDKKWLSHFDLELYVMDSDGGNAHLLRQFDGQIKAAAWSPDGRQILCICDDFLPEKKPDLHIRVDKPQEPQSATALYVMESDGGNAHLLRTLDGPIFAAAWSPDGKTLAVYGAASPSTDHGPIAGLFVMPVYGQGEVGPIGIPGGSLAWRPDGRKLAFTVFAREQDAYSALGVGDADGSHRIQLTDPHQMGEPASPAWSPDGRQIAFDAFASYRFPFKGVPGGAVVTQEEQIFLMGADGSNQRQLTSDHNWHCRGPNWSPDGTEIAFSCHAASAPCSGGGMNRRGCVRRIFVLSLTDPNAKPVQITQHDGANPVFAPVP